jgi:hypothetical protein
LRREDVAALSPWFARQPPSGDLVLHHRLYRFDDRDEQIADHRPQQIVTSEEVSDRWAVPVIQIDKRPTGPVRQQVSVPELPKVLNFLGERAPECGCGDETTAATTA